MPNSDLSAEQHLKKLKGEYNDLDARLFDFGRLSSDWVWETDADRHITYTSQRIFDYFGVPPQAAIGRKIDDFGTFLDENENPITPDFLAPFRGILLTKSTDPSRQNGYFKINCLPIFDVRTGAFTGIRGTMADITEDRATKQAIQTANEELEVLVKKRTDALFEIDQQLVDEINIHKETRLSLKESADLFHAVSVTSPVAVFLSRISDGEILFANDMASEILGYPLEKILGEKITNLFIDSKSRRMVRELADVNSPTKAHQLGFQTRNGDFRWGQFSTQPTQLNSEDALLTAVMDITDLRTADRQLLHAAKLATLGELSASIAHEINQPLSVIGMATEAALSLLDDEDDIDIDLLRAKIISVFQEQRRLVSISNHMRMFSRENDPDAEVFLPFQSCQYVVNFARDDLARHGIKLDFNADITGEQVYGSSTALEQVLLNVVTNARDALTEKMKQDTNASFVPSVRFHGSVQPEGASIVLRIANNGGPIPEESLPNIFQPFYTTKEKTKGTGLGLPISKRLIEAMDGTITVNNLEDGVEFLIQVPCKQHDPEPQIDVKEDDRLTEKPKLITPENISFDGKHVLVVDDTPSILNEVKDFLVRHDANVTTANDGRQALNLFNDQSFDALVTDIQMPYMDGIQLIQSLRAQKETIPIIVMTANPALIQTRPEVVSDVSAVLKKPFETGALLGELQTIFM